MSDRQSILELNQAAREGTTSVRHAPMAEHTLRIPRKDWNALVMLYPGLKSKDHDEYEDAMRRLHESPFADAYRVRTRKAQLGHF